MNKQEIKKLLKQAVLAAIVLFLPLILLFTLPPAVLSLWLTGIIVLYFKKRQHPELAESIKFQMIEKLLYLQIITWSFAFFFAPFLNLITVLIPIITFVLALKKSRRSDPQFIKWAKYIGFHIINFISLLALVMLYPNLGETGIFGLSIITFVNSAYAVVYLKLESKIPRQRKVISLIILLIIMASMTLSMFPQEDNISLFNTIFGG